MVLGLVDSSSFMISIKLSIIAGEHMDIMSGIGRFFFFFFLFYKQTICVALTE
jgi:hypothetical protein